MNGFTDFNPRSREGSDHNFVYLSKNVTISIHAPAKGATVGQLESRRITSKFQSTLPRRERLL